jgi:hypothetical protein
MSNRRLPFECKEEADRQIVEQGYSAAEVIAHSFYRKVKAMGLNKSEQHAAAWIAAKNEIFMLS